MAKEKVIKLNNARNIFPSKVTRIRPHDLVSMSSNKLLSEKEQKRMLDTASEIRRGDFGGEFDVLVIRNGKRLRIIPFN